MAKGTRVRFDAKKWGKALFKELAQRQTELLVAYAQEKIQRIGDFMQAYQGRNNMDRTGNLLDSLCWGVAYNGKLEEFGYYRQASATRVSHMHEFFPEDWQEVVYGRGRAEKFVERQKNVDYKGWRVFFAVLAPYWAYWESGFRLRTRGGNRFLKWNVMSQVYDEVRMELKPAEVHLTVTIEHYTKRKLAKAAKKHSEQPYDKVLNERFNPKTPFK